MRDSLLILALFGLMSSGLHAGSLTQNSLSLPGKGLSGAWAVESGKAALDSGQKHNGQPALRLESQGADAVVRSAPVSLKLGAQYELSAFVRTDAVAIQDRDRNPIALGASLAMASLPFDMHSESLAGNHGWTRLSLRFTATRTQDQALLTVGQGGSFQGKVWFSNVTLEEAPVAKQWPAKAAVTTFGPAYRYPNGGWIYLHIEGKPYERGYQHGYLMSHEIVQYLDRCASELDPKNREHAWSMGRTMADALFLRGFDDEILQEMKGIAAGAAAAGAKYRGRAIDLQDIVAANTITELGLLSAAMPMTPTGLEPFRFDRPAYAARPGSVPVTERCSAFAATGKATKDGKMVIAHITMWPLTLAEQTNIMLDIKPEKGQRVLMQSYPGGIQSGTDYYQNDAGMVLTETTIRQSPFNRDGYPVAYRARKAIQYGTSVEEVVKYLETKNNGLYTNEWLIGDSKNNEIAMFELGTYKTKLWRSSKNEWFGNTEGFYWGCNNAKDMAVRSEYVPDPQGEPESLTFVPSVRDIKWQDLYEKYKGKIDEQFAFLAFHTAPLVSSTTMDAKVATAEMAQNMMVWAAFGKPNQREWVPSRRQKDSYNDNTGIYPSGYRLISAQGTPDLMASIRENEASRAAAKKEAKSAKEPKGLDKDQLWKGWLLPASDSDLWLTSGGELYFNTLSSSDPDKARKANAARYEAASLQGDIALSRITASTRSAVPAQIAMAKGALLLESLEQTIGQDKFLALMRDFYASHTTKPVSTVEFIEAANKAAGRNLGDFFKPWLEETGLPGKPASGAVYVLSDFYRRLPSALIVYGTRMDAGANRYAAEQLQIRCLDIYESKTPIIKDYELTQKDLQTHDVLFVGRPETNSALAAVQSKMGLQYDDAAFTVGGKTNASEYAGLLFAAPNPEDPRHMAVVWAGNSALETVRLKDANFGNVQHAVFEEGKLASSGF